jgi:ZIP family zinc transporter
VGPVVEAAFWGFVGGVALLVGGYAGIRLSASLRSIGLVMAFGSGVLISALTFELMREASDLAGGVAAVVAMIAGSLTFFVGDWFIDRRGGDRRKSPHKSAATTGGMVLVLGSLLDGIPESAAIGVSLIGGGSVGVAVVAAVFLSNVPEALSASAGMKASGRSTGSIMGIWLAVTAASTLAAALGYAVLSHAGDGPTGAVEAFAAGAVLTMLVDTMVPEAVEHAGALVGIVTALGFAAAFLLSVA